MPWLCLAPTTRVSLLVKSTRPLTHISAFSLCLYNLFSQHNSSKCFFEMPALLEIIQSLPGLELNQCFLDNKATWNPPGAFPATLPLAHCVPGSPTTLSFFKPTKNSRSVSLYLVFPTQSGSLLSSSLLL